MVFHSISSNSQSKLLICGIRFDFSHPNEVEAREMKRNTLIELTDVSESMACELDMPLHP